MKGSKVLRYLEGDVISYGHLSYDGHWFPITEMYLADGKLWMIAKGKAERDIIIPPSYHFSFYGRDGGCVFRGRSDSTGWSFKAGDSYTITQDMKLSQAHLTVFDLAT